MRVPTVYLAGAIRDTHPEDIEWRERLIALFGARATILNPLAGKGDPPGWVLHGLRTPDAKFIVAHDFWAIDRADVIVFNFSSLSDGYPSIGTLCEFGRATGTGALLYTILDRSYQGHENPGVGYALHPFLEQNSAAIFHSIADAAEFLVAHLGVLSGENPHWRGRERDAHSL